MLIQLNKNKYFILFSIIFLLFGILIYKDFGLGIEENFQRSSGLYWLNYLLGKIGNENLFEITQFKISEIYKLNPNLPPVEIAKHYGVLFDLPLALLETVLKINDSVIYFRLRHLINFIIFFLSGIFYYKILINKTKNYNISFFSSTLYFLAPRIFGNSFFDGKDLFFLSIFTITIYFYFKYEEKYKFKYLFLFALFCAFSTSSRIFGIILPFSFFLLTFIKLLNSKNNYKLFKTLVFFLLLYFILLFFHWPYLWTLTFNEYLNFFKVFKVHNYVKVFFNGEFYESNYLPLSYLPKLIFLSTPIYFLVLFFIGFFIYVKRFFNRLISLREKSIYFDLWRGLSEKKDFIIFILFLQISIIYLSFNINLFSGWRHFLFLNFFLVYFASISINFFYLRFYKKKKIIFFASLIFLICSSELVYKLIIYHPYQSIYFNNLVSDNLKKKFEIDTQSLSRVDAIKDIISNNYLNQLTIGTASWTPLEEGIALIDQKYHKFLFFSGTANKQDADFIFTNHYYEVDTRYNNKYEIPKNFSLFKTKIVDGINIYTIFKKQK